MIGAIIQLLLHIGRNASREKRQQIRVVCSKISWGGLVWWQQCNPRKMLQLLPSFKIEYSILELQLSQNYYTNMNISCPSPSHIPCLKDCPHSLTKHENKRTSNISSFPPHQPTEKKFEVQWKLLFKNPNFQFRS